MNIGDITINNNESNQKSLAEVAQEIQELLQQLSETYPLSQVPAQAEIEVQKRPKLRDRIINALKAGGKATLEECIEHPAGKISIAVFEGWTQAE